MTGLATASAQSPAAGPLAALFGGADAGGAPAPSRASATLSAFGAVLARAERAQGEMSSPSGTPVDTGMPVTELSSENAATDAATACREDAGEQGVPAHGILPEPAALPFAGVVAAVPATVPNALPTTLAVAAASADADGGPEDGTPPTDTHHRPVAAPTVATQPPVPVPIDSSSAAPAGVPADAVSPSPASRGGEAARPAVAIVSSAGAVLPATAVSTAPAVSSAPIAPPVPRDAAPSTRGVDAPTPVPASAPASAIVSVPVSALAPLAPSDPTPEASAARPIAAQVAPVVLSIVQRPVGSHQLTMTVTPDTLGPVTVRAHIGTGGEVRVELIGASDAGRDALRTIVADLRRDLAAVMPHASLSLTAGTGADGGDRSAPSAAGSAQGTGAQSSSAHGGSPDGGRPDGRAPGGRDHGIPTLTSPSASDDAGVTAAPLLRPAVSGAGLDIFA